MNSFSYSAKDQEAYIASLSMSELKKMLCKESNGEPYYCIDCENQCAYGKRAVELVEAETRKNFKHLTKKEQYAAHQKCVAMENYLEAMAANDPIQFVINKYGSESEKVAKNKIYQWQHNYGTNLAMVSRRLSEIKTELAVSQAQVKIESPKPVKREIESETPNVPVEEKKPGKHQEEKISQKHLEQMRSDFENEVLSLEQQIEDHKKGIELCEKRIKEIADKVTAVRQVLDIFKEKESKYAI